MSLRGLLSRLRGRSGFERGCFAIQLLIDVGGAPELRRRLEAAAGPRRPRHRGHRSRYAQLAAVIDEASDRLVSAAFAYETDPDEAVEEYSEWVSELESTLAAEAAHPTPPAEGAAPAWEVLSVVLLLSSPHPWDARGALRAPLDDGQVTLDPDDDDAYTRRRMASLFGSVHLIAPADVVTDALFLVSGGPADPTADAPTAPGWDHLTVLR